MINIVTLYFAPLLIFLTGLSGSGKSTIGKALQAQLYQSTVFDGDVLRNESLQDLPHGKGGRQKITEQIITRCIEIFHVKNYPYVIATFVAPEEKLRSFIKQEIEKNNIHFIEVYIKTPIDVCERRDPKGLYKLLKEGKEIHLAGITEPYEEPKCPDVICETITNSVEENIQKILSIVNQKTSNMN